MIKTTALVDALCDVLAGRGGVAGAVADEAKTLSEGDLATDADGLGGVVLAGAAMVSVDSDWLGRRVPITKFL